MAKYKKKQQAKKAIRATVNNTGTQNNTGAQNNTGNKGSANILTPQLLEQQRATHALKRIQVAVERPEEGKYKHSQVKSFCRRFPGMVQSNGFGQAVAFFYSKRNDYPAYGTIYSLVEEWLCQEGQVYAAFKDATEPKLLTAITQSDQNTYRQATAETQALMVWVKKFAEGLILKEEEGH